MLNMSPEIRNAIERKLKALDLELFDIKVFQAGPRLVVRVFIDNEDGVSIGNCEKASHEISMILEVENFTQKPYTLEVSSPGLDRPLVSEKDFQRSLSKMLRLRVENESGKAKTVEGRLVEIEENRFLLEIKGQKRPIEREKVLSGKVIPEFS